MAIVDNNDLFIANRDGKTYKVTGADLYESFGGGGPGPGPGPDPGPQPVEPDPGQNDTANPAYDGGTGSAAQPYILTPTSCFIAGQISSPQVITLYGFDEGQSVKFEDLNVAANGGRFAQPNGTIDSSGSYSFKVVFQDLPPTIDDDPDSPTTYTALIKCGNTHWQWAVTMLNVGITAPRINTVKGSDGKDYDVPTEPLYLTDDGPLASISYTDALTGLDASDTTGLVSVTTTTGQGSGAKLNWYTTDTGTVQFVEVAEGGSGYSWGDTGTVDLSGIGGPSSVSITLYTQPATGNGVQFTVTGYESINAGSFLRSEWQFDTTASFLSPYETTSVANTQTVTINNGQSPNSVYFGRFRYISDDGEPVISAWSNIVRCTMASQMTARYILKDFDLAKTPTDGTIASSFDSDDFSFYPMHGMYIVSVLNSFSSWDYQMDKGGRGNAGSVVVGGFIPGTNSAWNCQPQNGLPFASYSTTRSSDGRNYTAAQTGAMGTAAVYLQVRPKHYMTVDEVSGEGGIVKVSFLENYYGMNDYFVLFGNTIEIQNHNVTNSSASGARIHIQRDEDNGSTVFQDVSDVGSGYTVGDVVFIQGPIGNGSNTQDYGSDVTTGFMYGTLDSFWDTLIHGIGGYGGQGYGNKTSLDNTSENTTNTGGPKINECRGDGPCAGRGGFPCFYGGGTDGGGGSAFTNIDYAAGGSAGTCGSYDGNIYGGVGAAQTLGPEKDGRRYGNGGGGGGGGWPGGGSGGGGAIAGDLRGVSAGGGGSSGGSFVNPIYIEDPESCITTANYGTRGIEIYINGVIQGSINTNGVTAHQIL